MKWAIIVNGEIEIRDCEEDIKGMELGSYYDILEYVSMGMELNNGFIRVNEGVVIALGEYGEDIELVRFTDL